MICFCRQFVVACFYHKPVAACFIANLLWRVVLSSMVSFFVGFHIDSLDDKIQSNKVIKSIQIWNLKYFKHFFFYYQICRP